MKRRRPFTLWWGALALAALLLICAKSSAASYALQERKLVCGGSAGADIAGHSRATTAGIIAVANLDHRIAQLRDNAGAEELLIARSRFLGDYVALDRAVSMTDRRVQTGDDLLRRARTRSAVHRFADALVDLDAAERTGADGAQAAALRASILVATGHADETIPALENELSRNPGFASRSSLATAYAAAGRISDADRLYAAALADLDTTSPFPYAWLYFVRGMMWAEQAGDPRRGAAFYAQALVKLPEFATANIHLAELEAARGDLSPAIARLRRVAAANNEPEALALLGELRLRLGDRRNGLEDIEKARRRYESLLDRHPLAFADHAAEFYLGPGDDAERAWVLAKQNLANRGTPRAFAIAIDAARATGRDHDARVLAANARAKPVD